MRLATTVDGRRYALGGTNMALECVVARDTELFFVQWREVDLLRRELVECHLLRSSRHEKQRRRIVSAEFIHGRPQLLDERALLRVAQNVQVCDAENEVTATIPGGPNEPSQEEHKLLDACLRGTKQHLSRLGESATPHVHGHDRVNDLRLLFSARDEYRDLLFCPVVDGDEHIGAVNSRHPRHWKVTHIHRGGRSLGRGTKELIEHLPEGVEERQAIGYEAIEFDHRILCLGLKANGRRNGV
mmetsp:Transcript_93895/g.268885  ORF Transcript_93895/g.268885 Transcript_93895/m.268885 type:complete len:243 (-) Transcript_93895:76-804(-)